MLDDLAFLQSEPLHDRGDAIASEQAHQVIFQGEEELRGSGVALPACASAQLPVDAPGLMPFGTHDMETTIVTYAGTELNIGPAAGHVGGNGNGAGKPRVGDNFSLALMLLRIQHIVRDVLSLEHPADRLGDFHAGGAHQDRPGLGSYPLDFFDNRS